MTDTVSIHTRAAGGGRWRRRHRSSLSPVGIPAAIALVAGLIRYASAELVVTTQRVAIKDGVLRRPVKRFC